MLLFMLALALMSVLELQRQLGQLEQRSLAEVHREMGRLQRLVEKALAERRLENAEQELKAYALIPEFSVLAAVDQTARVMFATSYDWEGHPAVSRLPGFDPIRFAQMQRQRRTQITLDADRGAITGYAPVFLRPRHGQLRSTRIGALYGRYELGAAQAEIRSDVLADSLVTGVLGLLAVALLMYLLDRMVSRPIARLAGFARRLSPALYGETVAVQGAGELKTLAEALNQMSSTIRGKLEALSESEARFRNLVESTNDWVWVTDRDGRYTYASPRVKALLGYEPEEVIGKTPFDLMAADEAERVRRWFSDVVQARNSIESLENINWHKDGYPVVLETSGVPILNAAGELIGYQGIDRDITARRQAEAERRLAASVFDGTNEAIMITDRRGTILRVNRAFTEITGFSVEEAVGQTPRLIRSDHHDDAFFEDLWAALRDTGRWQGEIWNRRKDGGLHLVWQSISALRSRDGGISHYIAVFSDITERKVTEERVRHLAHYDVLTDLPNRLLFNERCAHALERARRARYLVGILFLDLDRFKHINDSLGHPIGDRVLREVAERFVSAVREGDTVARLGGDEFIIILEEIHSATDAAIVAAKLLRVLEKPLEVDGYELRTSASIGVTLYPQDGLDVTSLVKNADAAMYRAKAKGSDNYQFYTRDLTATALERVMLENELRRALERRELTLFFQPQFSLPEGRLTGAEALLRWVHPEHGLLHPSRFIRLAEESGLIIPVGEWVLGEACRQLAQWVSEGLAVQHIAVNVSPVQVDRQDFVAMVQQTLSAAGIAPDRLELEVTEGFLMAHAGPEVPVLDALRNLGVSFAIDDFGTGYSSLSYLKRLAIDRLKIDRSFVRDILQDPNGKAIARAILALGHSLQIKVVAEGVETKEQYDFLLGEGCDEAQGNLLGEPMPATEFKLFVSRHRPVPRS
jgi:diguanylate cyclase (GGDEF)-like protein/PAS domain S-box-containing protein